MMTETETLIPRVRNRNQEVRVEEVKVKDREMRQEMKRCKEAKEAPNQRRRGHDGLSSAQDRWFILGSLSDACKTMNGQEQREKIKKREQDRQPVERAVFPYICRSYVLDGMQPWNE